MSDLLSALESALAGRYVVERELGRGGMAIVYLARDVKHDRPVALKVLPPELAASVGAEAFLHEIQVTARFQHPLILPLHDSGSANGLLFYVMPFVEGESLRDRLRREGQLPVADAVRIARDVAEALAYAHEKDVVHRDIKPENILLTSGHAVVADFGIARAIEVARGETVRQSQMVSGTPTYMSPEQATGSPADGRTDVYSLGAVLYEMLAGGPPFVEPTTQRLLQRILTEPPPSVRAHRPLVTEALDQVVSRSLEKLPADRFAGAVQLGAALAALPPDTARVTAASPDSAGRAAGPGIPRVLALFAGVAVLILAVVYFLVQFLGLPDWVVPAAGVLLLLGIPVLAATAHVQSGRFRPTPAAGTSPGAPRRGRRRRRWLSWRNAIWGGVAAFAALGLAVGGYMISRSTGIGPAASLVSAGVLDERDPILVADFENTSADPLLGATVQEALSVDLAQSPTVVLMPRSEVVEALARMERDPDTPMSPELARELAVRDGVKAVITGQVLPAGHGYVLAASLVASDDGRVLAGFREGAAGPEDVIPAIDRLSRRMREKIGESLRSIRSDKPLEQVTTQSLSALQKYSAAIRAEEFEGNQDKALALLEEAVALDSTFAMAHRKLATILGNTDRDPAREHRAIQQAFAHRERLPDRERYLTEASYYMYVEEPERAIAAYQRILDLNARDAWALNNIGVVYGNLGRFRESMEYYRRANEAEPSALVLGNISVGHVSLGEYDEALRVNREFGDRYPENPFQYSVEFFVTSSRGEFALAESLALARLELDAVRESPFRRGRFQAAAASMAEIQGRLSDADRGWERATASFVSSGALLEEFWLATNRVWRDVFILEDPALAATDLEVLESEYPLERFEIAVRPYDDYAILYALAGNTAQARSILERQNREVDPLILKRRATGSHEVEGILGLAENRPRDAVDEFLRHRSMNPGEPLSGLAGLAHAYDLAGEADSARVVYERFLATPGVLRFLDDMSFRARTLLRLGEIYEAQGDLPRALDYYSRFVELWKDADPVLQPRVRAVRQRIERLTLESGRS